MKSIILFFLLVVSASAKEALSFPELLAEIEEAKARRALVGLNGKGQGDFHIDWYSRHFLLNEKDKIAHIIYIFSNEEIIDGELAFRVTRMFSREDPEKGNYDSELAENRFARIESIPPERIKNFIRSIGGDFATFKKNLVQFKSSLEIK